MSDHTKYDYGIYVSYTNPGAAVIERIIRLLELEKQARDDFKQNNV